MEEECWVLKPAGDRVGLEKSAQQPPACGAPCQYPAVAAAWSLGELNWPETEGARVAAPSTVPHDPAVRLSPCRRRGRGLG